MYYLIYKYYDHSSYIFAGTIANILPRYHCVRPYLGSGGLIVVSKTSYKYLISTKHNILGKE